MFDLPETETLRILSKRMIDDEIRARINGRGALCSVRSSTPNWRLLFSTWWRRTWFMLNETRGESRLGLVESRLVAGCVWLTLSRSMGQKLRFD